MNKDQHDKLEKISSSFKSLPKEPEPEENVTEIPKESEVGKSVSESFKNSSDEEIQRIKSLFQTPVKEYLRRLRDK
jgi:hypothetical protein